MSTRLAARAAAGAGVVALGVLLVWHLTHQPASVARAVAQQKIVAAPNFDLRRLEGTGKLSLASLRGKAVVVNFWASDCAPCKQEMPRLVSFARRWSQSRRVIVVGIDIGEYRAGPARSFAARYGVTYPTVFDPAETTAAPWGLLGTPETFFIDRRGRIVHRVIGPVSNASLAEGLHRALTA